MSMWTGCCVLQVDKGVAKHLEESGSRVEDLLDDLKERRKDLLQVVLDKVEEVSFTEDVGQMKDLIEQADMFGQDGVEQVSSARLPLHLRVAEVR